MPRRAWSNYLLSILTYLGKRRELAGTVCEPLSWILLTNYCYYTTQHASLWYFYYVSLKGLTITPNFEFLNEYNYRDFKMFVKGREISSRVTNYFMGVKFLHVSWSLKVSFLVKMSHRFTIWLLEIHLAAKLSYCYLFFEKETRRVWYLIKRENVRDSVGSEIRDIEISQRANRTIKLEERALGNYC